MDLTNCLIAGFLPTTRLKKVWYPLHTLKYTSFPIHCPCRGKITIISQHTTECQRRKNIALDSFQLFKGLNSKNLPLGNIFPTNSEDARKATQLFFVVQQCSDQTFLNIKNYNVYAPEAVNCDIIRKGENADRTTASWVAIVILILTILLMVASTILFFVRSRQLASVELWARAYEAWDITYNHTLVCLEITMNLTFYRGTITPWGVGFYFLFTILHFFIRQYSNTYILA